MLISTQLISVLKASCIIVYFRVFSLSSIHNRYYSTSEVSIVFNQVNGIRKGLTLVLLLYTLYIPGYIDCYYCLIAAALASKVAADLIRTETKLFDFDLPRRYLDF